MLRLTAISFMLVVGNSPAAWSQTASCSDVQKEVETKVARIESNFSGKIDDVKKKINSESQQIQDDAPNPDNAVEAAIQFDIDVSSHNEEFKFHLPEVTVKDQKIALDLPQVTMKEQKWIFDVPATKMGLQCIPGVPETVCRMRTQDIGFGVKIDIPECYMRPGPDICTDVPEFYMERHEAILGIPEFKMDRTEFVMGIPEITMKEQKIILTIPDFTIKNIKAQVKETEQKAKELSASANKETALLSTSLKSEIEQASVQGIRDSFECQRRKLEAQKIVALAKLDGSIEIFSASLNKAREVGAADVAAQMSKSVENLIAARSSAGEQFNGALAGLNTSMEDAIKAALGEGFTTFNAVQ